MSKKSPSRPLIGATNVKSMSRQQQVILQALSVLLVLVGLGLVVVGLWNPVMDYIQIQRYAEYIISHEESDSLLDDEVRLFAPQTELTASAAALPSMADNPLPGPTGIDPTSPAENVTAPTALPTITPLTEQSVQALIPTSEAQLGEMAAPEATPVPPTATPVPPTATPVPILRAQMPPSRIVIDRINLDSPIEKVGWYQTTVNGQNTSVWEVAEYAAGWHKNSALPGHTGNVVISGHNNVAGEVFRDLVELEQGDSITVYADGIAFTYVVEDKKILKDKGEPLEVRQRNARWINEFNDERITLITCWPYTNNTHRVIVIAKPHPEFTQVVPQN